MPSGYFSHTSSQVKVRDGGELAHHGLKHVSKHALGAATLDGSGSVSVKTVLHRIEVLGRDTDDEVVPGTIGAMEVIVLVSLRRLLYERLQAGKSPLVKLEHLVGRDVILVGEVVEVAE